MSAPVVCCTGKENFGREETEKKGRMGNRRDEENDGTRTKRRRKGEWGIGGMRRIMRRERRRKGEWGIGGRMMKREKAKKGRMGNRREENDATRKKTEKKWRMGNRREEKNETI